MGKSNQFYTIDGNIKMTDKQLLETFRQKQIEYKRLNGEQNALKLILNSCYGFLGYQWGNFNYYKGASDTTEWGRKIAKQMNIEAEKLGGKVVRTDTDGSLVIVPQEFRGDTSSEMKFIKMVEDKVNEWLEKEL